MVTQKGKNGLDENRRRLLQALGLLIGASSASKVLGDSAVSVAMAYAPKKGSGIKQGKVFTASDLKALRAICAIVIPNTETPGAAEVGVQGFIDNQMFHCHSVEGQAQVKQVIHRIDRVATKRYRAAFSKCPEPQQYSLLNDLEKTHADFRPTDRDAFKLLKGLIVFGYYTSEVGASQELAYVAVPGGFKGSVPYGSIGRAWGSIPFL